MKFLDRCKLQDYLGAIIKQGLRTLNDLASLNEDDTKKIRMHADDKPRLLKVVRRLRRARGKSLC